MRVIDIFIEKHLGHLMTGGAACQVNWSLSDCYSCRCRLRYSFSYMERGGGEDDSLHGNVINDDATSAVIRFKFSVSRGEGKLCRRSNTLHGTHVHKFGQRLVNLCPMRAVSQILSHFWHIWSIWWPYNLTNFSVLTVIVNLTLNEHHWIVGKQVTNAISVEFSLHSEL